MKKIPYHLRPGLQRYIKSGVETGGFLQACLENRRHEAYHRAIGDETVNAIPEIFEFLENRAPAACWGSPEQVEVWIKTGGQEGRG